MLKQLTRLCRHRKDPISDFHQGPVNVRQWVSLICPKSWRTLCAPSIELCRIYIHIKNYCSYHVIIYVRKLANKTAAKTLEIRANSDVMVVGENNVIYGKTS